MSSHFVRILSLLVVAILSVSLLSGCNGAESASPPSAGLTVAAGDGQVTVSWQMDSGVDYWLFYAPGTNVVAGQPSTGYVSKMNISSPYILTGLTNGSTYAFVLNGRKNGGPGGPSTPVVTVTPRPAGSTWQRGGAGGSADLRGIAYGTASSGTAYYDAVGNSGSMYQSTDGITWVATAGNWAGVAGATNFNATLYASSKFIAVGAAGKIFYSSDNVNWAAGTYPTPPATMPTLNALASNGARIAAVGSGGSIFYSDDGGVTWLGANVPAGSGDLNGVAYSTSSARWVAVGARGMLVTSTDGSNWSAVTAATPSTTNDLKGIAVLADGTKFAAVGNGGTVLTSSDGQIWTSQVLSGNADLLAVGAHTSGTNEFVAVGAAGAAFTSLDGITWVAQATGTAVNLLGVISAAGQFVAVGQVGTSIYSR